MHDPWIIRNRSKITEVIANAGAFLKVQMEFNSLEVHIWEFIRGGLKKNMEEMHQMAGKSFEEMQGILLK